MSDNHVVIGVYEGVDCKLYPFHGTPIVAEKVNHMFIRKSYTICKPYKIEIKNHIGSGYQSIAQMFPHPTFITFAEPISFCNQSQLIILGNQRYIYSRYKFFILINLIRLIISKRYPLFRVMRCLINVIF